MKNLLNIAFFTLIALSFNTLNAQWIDSGNTIFTNQNVGIGTSNPNQQLHLLGDGFIKLEQTGAANGAWGEVNSTAAGTLRLFQHDNDGFGGIDILANGNVGIGTINPISKLNIVGGSDANAVSGGYIITGSLNGKNVAIDNNEIQARDNGTVNNMSINYEGGGVVLGGPTANKRFYLKSNGNVGIGTSNPASKLNIVDGSDVNAARGGYIIAGNLNQHNLGIDNNEIQARNNGIASSMYLNAEGGNIVLGGPTASKRFFLNASGKVGIGTNSIPSGYKFAVDGKAIMEEVKIQLSQSWADYVFQEDYNLISLEEVEQTIEEKGHLHNIASAAEIAAAGGIEVGNITVNQQEKIEELFLHMIEMNKEVKALKQEIKDLKASK